MNFVRQIASPATVAGLVFMMLAAGVHAQSGRSLDRRIAILPFYGGSIGEQEGIPELFMNSREVRNNFLPIPRTGIIAAARQEQSFQALSGMTDADTIAKLGEQLNADYVMAGSITSLGSKNLLIVSIVKIDVIRQVAGVYLTYDSLDELNKDERILENMAAELIAMERKAEDNLDMLALLPVELSEGGNKQEGDALAQLLAIHLLRAGKYAVYPRTKTLEQVQSEYETQLKGGVTREELAVKAGEAVNPPYVLSVISRKIGTGTRFNASIIDLEGGYVVEGASELYANMTDGITAMEFLAMQLSGKEVSQRERDRRSSAVNSETKARETEERTRIQAEERAANQANARRAWAKTMDKFLQSSGIAFGGWLGFGIGGTGMKPDESGSTTINGDIYGEDAGFAGGGNLELRLYRYIGIQTGVNSVTNYAPYTLPGGNELYAKLTTVQIPILVRVNLIFSEQGMGFAGFAGLGMNIATPDIAYATTADPGKISFIAGGEYILAPLGNLELSLGYQWNGGIDDGSLTVAVGNVGGGTSNISQDYRQGSHTIYAGIRYHLPFRK
jgi:TolB-like protein